MKYQHISSSLSLLLLCLHYGCFAIQILSNLSRSGHDENPLHFNATGTARYLRSAGPAIRPEGQLPTVFIVGAQKGGALSLLDLITRHPLLCSSILREPGFFSDDSKYEQGTAAYKYQFHDAKCHKNEKYSMYVDGSSILHIPKVWQRIADTYNNDCEGRKLKDKLKFIVVLREPVSRDYVLYQHNLRSQLKKGLKFDQIRTFGEMTNDSNFKDENGLDTRYGRYVEQLAEFTKVFRRDQLLVLNSHVLFEDVASITRNIYQFINVPDETVHNVALPRVNHYQEAGTAFESCAVHHIPEMECSFRDRLGEYYESFNTQLYYWLGATRKEANINEPPFKPTFSSYKQTPCSENPRLDFDTYIGKEKDVIKLREQFKTKTNSFHLPPGACHISENQ